MRIGAVTGHRIGAGVRQHLGHERVLRVGVDPGRATSASAAALVRGGRGPPVQADGVVGDVLHEHGEHPVDVSLRDPAQVDHGPGATAVGRVVQGQRGGLADQLRVHDLGEQLTRATSIRSRSAGCSSAAAARPSAGRTPPPAPGTRPRWAGARSGRRRGGSRRTLIAPARMRGPARTGTGRRPASRRTGTASYPPAAPMAAPK